MAAMLASPGIFVRMVGIPISVGMITSIPYVRANGDPPLASSWLFCRPIILLVAPLPIFFWQNVGVFSELIGVFC